MYSLYNYRMRKEHTVILITGPTASGKTALSLELAMHFGTSIISADSRQCFMELDIGVAKPTPEELSRVRHYFINSHSITETVTAQVFETFALASAEEIFASNPVAVMAGGTGLYIKAFCEGLDAIPETDPACRKAIMAAYQEYGLGWLQHQVQEKDPVFWQVAEQQNPQRLMRALEVLESTGHSILYFRRNEKKERPFRIIKIGTDLPKDILHRNIDQRIDGMLRAGLVDEVRALLPFKELNAMQTVGYRELVGFFEGKSTLEEAVNSIRYNTRQYAKRQLTWFRKDSSINWIPYNYKHRDIDIILANLHI